MADREKLAELLEYHCALDYDDLTGNNCAKDCSCEECLADHLLVNGVTIQKWIPVTERLPEATKFVLVFGEGIVGEAVMDKSDGKFYWAGSDEYSSAIEVTHWMPLPEPPKEGE